MIPLRDTNPTRSTPFVTWTFIAANVVIFIVQFASGTQFAEALIMRFGVIPDVLVHGQWLGPSADAGAREAIVTPFTSMFLHGGLLHLLGNMWFLHVFGDNVEDVLGKGRYILFYVGTGLAAVAAQVMTDPSSTVPMIGASGAISGVLAGYLVLFPHARVLTLVPIFIFIQFIEVPAYLYIVLWFVFQVGSGYFALGLGGEGGGVAWFAHIGGFLAGLLWMKLAVQRRQATRRVRARR